MDFYVKPKVQKQLRLRSLQIQIAKAEHVFEVHMNQLMFEHSEKQAFAFYLDTFRQGIAPLYMSCGCKYYTAYRSAWIIFLAEIEVLP